MAEKPTIQQKQAEIIAKQLSNPRINEQDKGVIRNTFYDRYDLVLAIRNVMFNQASAADKSLVKAAFTNPEVARVVRKTLLPVMLPDDPLKQSFDLWQSVEIDGLDDDRIAALVQARKWLIDALDRALLALEDPSREAVDLDLDNKALDVIDYAMLKYRNVFISHVENQLVMIVTMAASTPQTPEEALERMKKDSNK